MRARLMPWAPLSLLLVALALRFTQPHTVADRTMILSAAVGFVLLTLARQWPGRQGR